LESTVRGSSTRPANVSTLNILSSKTSEISFLLEKVQKRAVKMMSGLKVATYEEKLRDLGVTTLEERRHQTDTL
jgi:hypothetical protein